MFTLIPYRDRAKLRFRHGSGGRAVGLPPSPTRQGNGVRFSCAAGGIRSQRPRAGRSDGLPAPAFIRPHGMRLSPDRAAAVRRAAAVLPLRSGGQAITSAGATLATLVFAASLCLHSSLVPGLSMSAARPSIREGRHTGPLRIGSRSLTRTAISRPENDPVGASTSLAFSPAAGMTHPEPRTRPTGRVST